MKAIKNPYFFTFSGISLIVYSLPKLGYSLPSFITSYVNDLLCMPVVLMISLFVVRIIRRERHLKLPVLLIFSLTTFYAIYFELYLPTVNSRYTRDLLDAFLYFTGASFFIVIQKRL